MTIRTFLYALLFLIFEALSVGATGNCWISDWPTAPGTNFVGANNITNHRTYWINYNGTTSHLSLKIKLKSGSPETVQIQKIATNINGLYYVPFSLPEDQGNLIHGPAKLIAKDDAGKCTVDFTIGEIQRYDTAGGTKIPDFTTLCTNLSVSNIDTVSHVRVGVYLQHTFDSDLQITLYSPGNMVAVPLSWNNGGPGDNYGNGIYDYYDFFAFTVFDDTASQSITNAQPPFQGIFIPQSPLSAFNGLTGNQANGTWSLCINDGVAGDEGYYLGGFLEITDQS